MSRYHLYVDRDGKRELVFDSDNLSEVLRIAKDASEADATKVFYIDRKERKTVQTHGS